MKELPNLVAAIVARRDNPLPPDEPISRAPAPLKPLPCPELSPALSAAVARFRADRPTRYGPARLGADDGDPGLVLSIDREPEFHPEAEAKLAEFRAASGPPSIGQVVEWFEPLAATLPFAPTDEATLMAYVGALMPACGRFPWRVWDAAAKAGHVIEFEKWPAPRAVFKLLEAKAAEQDSLIATLERMAKPGAPGKRGPARESPERYEIPPAPPERAPHRSMPKRDTEAELAEAGLPGAQEPALTVEQQLAALAAMDGLTVEQMLAKPTGRQAPKPEAKP